MLPSAMIARVPRLRAGFVAALAISGALVAFALAPASAGAADRGTLVWTDMRPLSGRAERGIAHLIVRPRAADSISAIAVGLVVDPANPNVVYGLRLSRRTCRDIKRNPASPGYVGGLIGSPEYFPGRSSGVWSGPVTLRTKDVRAARSVAVLLGQGDGTFQPVACGKAFKLENVLVSS